MDRLFRGILKFKKQDSIKHQELFQKLANQQKPHTLFITCSDSRIDPNLITKTLLIYLVLKGHREPAEESSAIPFKIR